MCRFLSVLCLCVCMATPALAKEVVKTTNAPEAIGPYSQAIKQGTFIFTSGQIPINPKDNSIPEGIEAQTNLVMNNLKAVLEAAGSDLDHVLKTTIFVQNLNDFATVNKIYASYFTKDYPGRSTVQVARLPRDVLIEIEAVAVTK